MTAADRLEKTLHRVQAACAQAKRPENEVRLLAVSKNFPASAIVELYTLGQRSFGENYLQEAQNKITQLADMPQTNPIEWHFIGPVQSNKTRTIAESFDWVHSVDRLKIAQRLSLQRPANGAPLSVLVQVNTSGETSKSGIAPADTLALCKSIAALPNLNLRGLMTLPNPNSNPQQLEQEFLLCKNLFDQLQAAGLAVDTLSMGMSNDLESAIQCGSTCVRVGTALFGPRNSETH